MSRTFDGPNRPSTDNLFAAGAAGTKHPRILVVDTDSALLGLLEEWLGGCNCAVEAADARSPAAYDSGAAYDLVIVDVPHPRRGGMELLQRLADAHPGTPIVALSSTFFPGIASNGPVARTLGVACVLPKPVARESLVAAVQSLLAR